MEFTVQGMSCGHCVGAVREAIAALDADARIDVDLASGRVAVESVRPREALVEAIRAAGYGTE